MKTTRKGFFGVLVAGCVAVCARRVKAGRHWYQTNKRPFRNHREIGLRVVFTGDEFSNNRAEIHRQLDELLAQMADRIDEQPANLWRIGELRLRARVGYAETPQEWAIARGEAPHPAIAEKIMATMKGSCEECGATAYDWKKVPS